MLSDHLNAEIVASTISSKQDAIDYITWTYFFRRLLINPTYYGLDDTDHNSINTFLSNLIEGAVTALQISYCVTVLEVWDVFFSVGNYENENTSNDLFIENQSLQLKIHFSMSRFIETNRDMSRKIIVFSHLPINAKWGVETLIKEMEIFRERFRRTVVLLSYYYRMNERLSRLC